MLTQPVKNNMSLIFPKMPVVMFCRRIKTFRARCQKRSEMRTGGGIPLSNLEKWTADLKIWAKTKNQVAVVVQDIVLYWIESSPTRNRRSYDTETLQQFLPSSKQPGIIYTLKLSGIYLCLRKRKLEIRWFLPHRSAMNGIASTPAATTGKVRGDLERCEDRRGRETRSQAFAGAGCSRMRWLPMPLGARSVFLAPDLVTFIGLVQAPCVLHAGSCTQSDSFRDRHFSQVVRILSVWSRTSISSGAIRRLRRLMERSTGMFFVRRKNTAWEAIEWTIWRFDFAISSETSLGAHLSERQTSSSPARHKHVGWHFHRVCFPHTGSHPRQEDRRIRSSCRKIQIPRSTRRRLHSKNIIFPCADGSVKQEEHVISRPHRFRSLQQEDQDVGGDSDALDLFPATPWAAERKAEEGPMKSVAFRAISFTVITLNLAVSYTCPLNRRSRYFWSKPT